MVVVCPKCHFPQTIYEKNTARQDLRTKVSFFYENVTCARNMVREYFNTTRKDKSSSINKTSVIALHSIGKCCSAARKVFTLLNLSPIVRQQHCSSYNVRLE